MNDLIKAVRRKTLEEVENLIESGANVNTEDEYGSSPLIESVKKKNIEMVKLLISKGADVTKIIEGRTPLTEAVNKNDIEIVKFLISKGADTDVLNNEGRTFLMEAVVKKNIEIVKVILGEEIDTAIVDNNGRTAISDAAYFSTIEIVDLLIASGAEAGDMALFIAVRKKDINEVKKVVESGFDINHKDFYGRTALMEAAFKGQLEIVKYLISLGADVNVKSNTGNSVLINAACYLEIVEYLVSLGPDVKTTENLQKTLMKAISWNEIEVIKFLLSIGADINTKDSEGLTPLTKAAWRGKAEAIEILLSAGADLEAEDGDGHTALIKAAFHGQPENVKFLLSAGADFSYVANYVNVRSYKTAHNESYRKVAEILTELGADKPPKKKSNSKNNVQVIMKKYLEYKDEKSARFWQIENTGKGFTSTYGKIGNKGRSSTKDFDSEEMCKKEVEKLIKQKIKKGYTEVDETKNEYIDYIKNLDWEMNPDDIISLLTYSIGADRVEYEGDIPVGSSKFGGTPDLPDSEEWPVFGSPEAFDKMDLAERKEKQEHVPFFAQINTREFDHKNQLPDGIYYYFFSYDEENVYGAKILFFDGDIKDLRKHKKPKNVSEIYDEDKLEFQEYYTLPMLGTEVDSLNFKGDDAETYEELDFDIYDPDIQILGHPILYQRDDSITAAKEKLLLYFVDENDHSIFAIESEDGEVMIAMEY